VRLKLSLLLIYSLLALGCRGVVEYIQFTRDEPNKTALVGTWEPDESTVRAMKDRGGYDTSLPTRLVLRSDGHFDLINMPDWWGGGQGESQRVLESDSGEWSLSQFAGSSFWSLILNSSKGQRSVNLMGQKPPYNLHFVLGDPDSNESMTFIKKS
jgi:hypothetical protein